MKQYKEFCITFKNKHHEIKKANYNIIRKR